MEADSGTRFEGKLWGGGGDNRRGGRDSGSRREIITDAESAAMVGHLEPGAGKGYVTVIPGAREPGQVSTNPQQPLADDCPRGADTLIPLVFPVSSKVGFGGQGESLSNKIQMLGVRSQARVPRSSKSDGLCTGQ